MTDRRQHNTRIAWFIGVGIGLVLSVASVAWGAENGQFGRVDAFYGSFSASVPIVAPKYHGIEPHVALNYSSTAGHGLAGVGWGVSGFSYVHRMSSGYGAPRFDASDRYALDGMELVPCTTLGGTHCPRIQNYTRIIRDTTNDRWVVTGTNGNRATYTPQLTAPGGVFRWALWKVEDTRGNTVTYSYTCDAGDCYPGAISYNGTVISFFTEARPDLVYYATGAGLGVSSVRLRSILVSVSNVKVRAYRLTYQQAASTAASELTSVQQYGSDVTIDGAGLITGGTTLPAETFTWSPESTASFTSIPAGTGCSNLETRGGDFDGDGRADRMCHDENTGTVRTLFSNGDGTFSSSRWNNASGNAVAWCVGFPVTAADFNRDGATDLLCHENEPGNGMVRIAFSNGDGSYSGTPYTTWCVLGALYAADVTGDGLTDLVCHGQNDHIETGINVSGGGYFLQVGWQQWCSDFDLVFGDFNGDGSNDLYCHRSGDPLDDSVALSNGAGGYAIQPAWANFCDTTTAVLKTGDFNGDGKTDVMCRDSSDGFTRVGLSTGNGGFTLFSSFTFCAGQGIGVADFSGDGRTDLRCQDGATGMIRIGFSRGDGSFNRIAWQSWCGNDDLSHGDFDGDGKSDLLCHVRSTGVNTIAVKDPETRFHGGGTGVRQGNLITQVANGVGGVTAVKYEPSSFWSNGYLPIGFVVETAATVTTSDGRGTSGSSSTVDYEFAGGLWLDSERRFLGFRSVKTVLDAAGNYTETIYHQREGSISKPEVTYYKDASGAQYSRSVFTYAESGVAPGPFTSVMTDRWDFECNLTATCRRTLTQMSYDIYGNVIETYEYGDYDVSGDERTTRRGFYPNPSSYVVGFPGYEFKYAGIAPPGTTPKSSTYMYYDLNPSYSAPPSVGNLTRVLRWDDTRARYLEELRTYDGWGNVLTVRDGVGVTEVRAYDSVYHQYLTSSCRGGFCSTRQTNGRTEVIDWARDENGEQTSYQHDVLGRLRVTTHPDSSQTFNDYFSIGNPNGQYMRQRQPDGAAGRVTDVYQDGLGRVYKTVKDGVSVKELKYVDASTRYAAESLWRRPADSSRFITYQYDGAQRLTRVYVPPGGAGDPFSRIDHFVGRESVYDENGNRKDVWKDTYGRVTRISEFNGTLEYSTTYQYDIFDNLIGTTDHAGRSSSFQWNSVGHKVQACTPDTGCSQFSYDGTGKPTTQRDPQGQCIAMGYDVLGRIVHRTPPNRASVRYYYDESGYGWSLGRLTRITYPGGSESTSWTQMGLKGTATRCVEGVCKTFVHQYDVNGRLWRLTYPDGEQVTYAYDAEGRLRTMSSGTTTYISNMTWNAAGQTNQIDYGNGTRVEYTYNPNREWLDQVRVVGPGSVEHYKGVYAYDPGARIQSVTSSTNPLQSMVFTYDGVNRLKTTTGGQTHSYDYDSTGNLTTNSAIGTLTYTDPNHQHAVSTIPGRRYSYDASGNMRLEEASDGCGGWSVRRSFTWDAFSRMTRATGPGGTADFVYDSTGARIVKRGASETQRFFGPLAEDTTAGGSTTTTKYYYAGGLLVAKRVGSTPYWYHQDHLGSVRVITDGAGAKVRTYDYAPFGSVAGTTGTHSETIQFGGHRTDAESGLVYAGARYYDPTLGRFVSPDSIVPSATNPQALNRYAFALNNPISNADVSGHLPVVVAVLAVAMVVAAGASPWVIAVAVVGAMLSIAGFALNNPWLSLVGGVLLGFAGGYASVASSWGTLVQTGNGLLGAAVAGVTSPVSPLDPGVKMAVGWAYSVYGWLLAPSTPAGNGELTAATNDVAESIIQLPDGTYLADDAALVRWAEAQGVDPQLRVQLLNDAVERGMQGFRSAGNQGTDAVLTQITETTSRTESVWGSSVATAYAGKVASKTGLTPGQALLLNPSGGLTGGGTSSLAVSGLLGRHAVAHDADGYLLNFWKIGGGYAAFPHPAIGPDLLLPGPLQGQIGGIAVQFSGSAPFGLIQPEPPRD